MVAVAAEQQTFPVEVTYGYGMYTAVCDALHIVTESKTFEGLTHRVWEVVPDMIEANDLPLDVESIRLRFEVSQSLSDQH